MVRSLWSGCLIALPSGAGVAMSVLGGNGASLVGVAISASLLPPTVNCVSRIDQFFLKRKGVKKSQKSYVSFLVFCFVMKIKHSVDIF